MLNNKNIFKRLEINRKGISTGCFAGKM